MTYGDKIRSMNDKELAEFLSACLIPNNDSECMYICGVGHFMWTEDLAKKLGEKTEISEDCVSRQAVKDAVENTIAKYIPTFIGEYEKIPLELARAIKDVPPATPTHGTCKDCKHWNKNKVYCKHLTTEFGWSEDEYYQVCTKPDFYCKDFEKRGNENGKSNIQA